MPPLGIALGLRAASAQISIPNLAPAYLAFHFFWGYCALTSRTPKQWFGIDHNVSPRYDLTNYGDEAVRTGKITQKQLGMLQRFESAYANSVENYSLFVGAMSMACFAGVDNRLVNRAGLVYTIARVAYGIVYVTIDHPVWSQIRGVTWWIGNSSCLFLLWKAYKKVGLSQDGF